MLQVHLIRPFLFALCVEFRAIHKSSVIAFSRGIVGETKTVRISMRIVIKKDLLWPSPYIFITFACQQCKHFEYSKAVNEKLGT